MEFSLETSRRLQPQISEIVLFDNKYIYKTIWESWYKDIETWILIVEEYKSWEPKYKSDLYSSANHVVY